MLAATVNRATSDLWYLLHRALITPCVQPCRNKLFQLSDCLLDGFEFLQKLTKRFFGNSEIKVSLQMFVYSQTKDYLDWQRLKKSITIINDGDLSLVADDNNDVDDVDDDDNNNDVDDVWPTRERWNSTTNSLRTWFLRAWAKSRCWSSCTLPTSLSWSRSNGWVDVT